MKIGFVGLGVMGKHMATNIYKGGFPLKVYDVVEDIVSEFKKAGAEAGESPADIATDCDLIFCSLPNSKIVSDVILGKDGILKTAKKGTTIVDLSSITPKTIRGIYKEAIKRGVEVLDAPVSGGVGGAEAGTLSIMVGGRKEIVEKVRPVFNCIGKRIYHVGEVGAGDAVKLVNNLLLGANMVAVAEAMVLGVKAGLDPEVLFEIISQSSGNSYVLNAKYPGFISEGSFAPGFMIDLQYKDLQLATTTAKELNVPLVMGDVAQQVYEIARAQELGREDISAVIKIYEQWADVEVRKAEK